GGAVVGGDLGRGAAAGLAQTASFPVRCDEDRGVQPLAVHADRPDPGCSNRNMTISHSQGRAWPGTISALGAPVGDGVPRFSLGALALSGGGGPVPGDAPRVGLRVVDMAAYVLQQH